MMLPLRPRRLLVALPLLLAPFAVRGQDGYAYFTPERPSPTAGCPGCDRWK